MSIKRLRKPSCWKQKYYIDMIEDILCPYYESTKSLEINRVQPLDPPPTIAIEQEQAATRSIQNDSPADNGSGYCNTFSTSSTDYNRAINVLRFYKEHQQQQQQQNTTATTVPDTGDKPVKRKKFRFCSLFKKMRLTAEKPFWSIDRYF